MQYLKNSKSTKAITLEELEKALKETVCFHFHLSSAEEMKRDTHKREIARARQFYWIHMKDFDPTLEDKYLAEQFGRDRSTIPNTERRHRQACQNMHQKKHTEYIRSFVSFTNILREKIFGYSSPISENLLSFEFAPTDIEYDLSFVQENWRVLIEKIAKAISRYHEISDERFRTRYDSTSNLQYKALFIGMVYMALGPETDRLERMDMRQIGQIVEPAIGEVRVRQLVEAHRVALARDNTYRYDHAAVAIKIPELKGVAPIFDWAELEEIVNR